MDKLQNIRASPLILTVTLVDSAPGLAAAVDMTLCAGTAGRGRGRVITGLCNGAGVLLNAR
ncbi:hypothetical protein KCP69_05080 [Salmonella enterica subsp. enterica]|nr:hypothetical protein KCP69_05080 [Salmonella enterica subsp. enterica]